MSNRGGAGIRRLKSPNRWSCLVTSFAMVLGVTIEELIAEIGHDGSEIIFPDLGEPLRRRAFHIQELVDCASIRGFSVTPIEGLPLAGPDSTHTFSLPLGNPSDRLRHYLMNHFGAITGLSKLGNPHAVAWPGIGKDIIDPSDGEFHPLAEFNIQTFWMCQKCLD